MRRPVARLAAAVALSLTVVLAGLSVSSMSTRSPSIADPVPEARCGPGGRPKPGIQGRVPLRHRTSGYSTGGYSCNLKMLGRSQGEGSSWVSPSNGTAPICRPASPATPSIPACR